VVYCLLVVAELRSYQLGAAVNVGLADFMLLYAHDYRNIVVSDISCP
jgi:hypothetical protein